MALAISAEMTPSSALTVAAAALIRASASMWPRSIGCPEIGKFSTARWVCARHLARAGTRTSPIESCSIRKSLSVMSVDPLLPGGYGCPVTVSPSGSPGDDPRGHLLASDAEREATVEQLRVAAADGRLTMEELADRSELAYRARTEGELSALTRDLPASHVAGSLPVAFDGQEPGESYVGVLSGATRRGRGRVPRRSKAVAVFGGVDLDMREAQFAAHDTYLRVVAVFS